MTTFANFKVMVHVNNSLSGCILVFLVGLTTIVSLDITGEGKEEILYDATPKERY